MMKYIYISYVKERQYPRKHLLPNTMQFEKQIIKKSRSFQKPEFYPTLSPAQCHFGAGQSQQNLSTCLLENVLLAQEVHKQYQNFMQIFAKLMLGSLESVRSVSVSKYLLFGSEKLQFNFKQRNSNSMSCRISRQQRDKRYEDMNWFCSKI